MTGTRIEPRTPLSKDRVLTGAVELADTAGVDALTMRNLAQHLGVEAMSLYYHVANKEAILDGITDVVVDEINAVVATIGQAASPEGWKTEMRERVLAAREVLLRHPWAPGVIETRTAISPATTRYFDDTLGVMVRGGFSYDLAHHALHALGSRAIGFTQELFKPDNPEVDDPETAEMLAAMADHFPYITGMLAAIVHDDPDSTLGWCDDQAEFEFGLDIMLDGLDHLRSTQY